MTALLIAELRNRSTKSAEKLLAELEMNEPSPQKVESPHPATTPEALPVAAPSRDLTIRYEALRATFTIEAELLARWGMTPALPTDLRSVVFALWEERLGESTDELGRNLANLTNDRSLADWENGR